MSQLATGNRPGGLISRSGVIPLSWVAAVLFCSGFSALVYQALWLRLLGLVFGVTTYAATTVLASFMVGLALGSIIGGRLASRVRHPVLWLGVAELLVGCAALSTMTVLTILRDLYVMAAPSLPGGLTFLTAVRALYAFAALLVPTTLMGATFPLALEAVTRGRGALGHQAAVLYATNTAGAVGGTLITGFVLVGSLGIARSFLLAATINSVACAGAIIAWTLATRRTAQLPPLSVNPREDSGSGTHVFSNRARRAVLAVVCVSGFISLALEIVWFRILVLLAQVTSYAFAMLLALVLIGLATGSAIASFAAPRRRDSLLSAVALIELLTAVSIVLSGGTLAVAPSFIRLGNAILGAGALEFSLALTSALAILPTTALMGAAFPLSLKVWVGLHGPNGAAGREVGTFYAINMAGAVLGAIAGGFVLLPHLGSRMSLILLGGAMLASAGLVVTVIEPGRRRPPIVAGVLLTIIFAISSVRLPDPIATAIAGRYPGERMLWHEEGIQTTASVHQRGLERFLYIDGLAQADDAPSTTKAHWRIGHLPMALHPDPRTALVIGLGGGATAGAVSQHPGVSVDIVELSRTVVDGSAWLRHVNFDVLRKPHVNLRVDDGRNYLLLTRKRYDVITADIIQPIQAGAGNIYSVEYFRLARSALADDGLILQWVGTGDANRYKLIARTFLSVFPETTVWADGTLMVGSKGPFHFDAEGLQRKLQDLACSGGVRDVRYADDRCAGETLHGWTGGAAPVCRRRSAIDRRQAGH